MTFDPWVIDDSALDEDLYGAEPRTAGDFPGHPFRGNQWTTPTHTVATKDQAKKDGFLLTPDQEENITSGRATLLKINIDDATENDEYPGGLKPMDTRVQRIKGSLTQGAPVLALEGYLNTEGKWEIADGKHRLHALKQLGRTHAYVVIQTSSLEKPWKVESGLRADL